MINLSKEDPVYYKSKIRELINQALQNGLKVQLNEQGLFFKDDIGERAGITKALIDKSNKRAEAQKVNRFIVSKRF